MTAEPIQHQDSLLNHPGPWTEEDYLALPEQEGQRVELIDGSLLVTPTGDLSHQSVCARLWRELEAVLPDEFRAFNVANVRLRTGRILGPDTVVTTYPDDKLLLEAEEVVLLGEVVSRWGKARDRILKPALYEAAETPWYLVVEQDPELVLILFQLVNGSYKEHSRAVQGERLYLPDLGVSIDVDALLRRR